MIDRTAVSRPSATPADPRVSTLQILRLMNFERALRSYASTAATICRRSDILAKCLLRARGKNRLAETMGKITVDSPIPYLLSDLTNEIQNEMGKLDKATNTAPYMRIKTKLDELKADPRYQFMFSGMLVGDTMAEFLAKIFRMPSSGKPIAIVDVSGVPSDITSTVVAVLSRLVFDSRLGPRGADPPPGWYARKPTVTSQREERDGSSSQDPQPLKRKGASTAQLS